MNDAETARSVSRNFGMWSTVQMFHEVVDEKK